MEVNTIIICDRCHRILEIVYAREDMSIQEYETMTINECHCAHCREQIEAIANKNNMI